MHKFCFYTGSELTKPHRKEILKAEKELQNEVYKQMDIIYHAASIALFRYHGWKTEQLYELIAEVSQSVWNECAGSPDESMIEMLWNEVGIELQCEDKTQRWFEISYLNSELVNYKQMTYFQFLAMKQNQKKWVAPQLTACMLMSLWRKERWTEKALGKLFQQIEDIKHENKLDPDRLRQLCYEETGFWITDDINNMDRVAVVNEN